MKSFRGFVSPEQAERDKQHQQKNRDRFMSGPSPIIVNPTKGSEEESGRDAAPDKKPDQAATNRDRFSGVIQQKRATPPPLPGRAGPPPIPGRAMPPPIPGNAGPDPRQANPDLAARQAIAKKKNLINWLGRNKMPT